MNAVVFNPKKVMVALGVLFVFFVSSLYAADDKYTMEDLKVLDKEGKHIQVLEHMNDIRPSQRNEEWQVIVQRAVMNYLEKLATSEDSYMAFNFAEQMLDTQPTLKNDDAFINLRRKAVIRSIKDCYQNSYNGSECTDLLSTAIKKTPSDQELAFQSAKLVRLNTNSANAVPFFVQAMKDNPDLKKCTDEDLIIAVQSGMKLPPDKANAAFELGFSICYEPLKPYLLENFYKSSGYATTNYCSSLSMKKALTPFQKAYCADKQ